MIQIINDFSGASLGEYRIQEQAITAVFRKEPHADKDWIRHDYNWHFIFGVRNSSDAAAPVEIYLNCEKPEPLPCRAAIFGQNDVDSEFQPLNDIEALTDTLKKYVLKLTLSSGETRFLSNTYFRSLRFLENRFSRLSENEHCGKEIFGRSVEGRDLTAYVYSRTRNFEDGKPVFVVTSGFHPMEADTFATEALMEFLSDAGGRRLLSDFHFVIIPVVNPDGFFHGYNGCNSKGVNLYWNFMEKNEAMAPEAYHLWRYLQKIRPALYLDFHSYTFQLHRKKASPYLKPLYFYRGAGVQDLVRAIDRELLALHDGSAERGPLTFAPSTLASKLTRRWNTITYAKYHLHIGEGKDAYKKKAVSILDKISRTFIEKGFVDRKKILTSPEGETRDRLSDKMKRTFRTAWIFRIKYPLLRLRSKLKGAA
jgi:hypothetical protein